MTLSEERIACVDALGFGWSTNLRARKSDKLMGVFEVPKEDNVSYNCSIYAQITVAILTRVLLLQSFNEWLKYRKTQWVKQHKRKQGAVGEANFC